MDIDLTPTLIDMVRETFEGEVKPGWVWIVSGPASDSVLGTLDQVTFEQAYKVPRPGRKSIAAHAHHLKYTLELMLKRFNGENPPADWPGSFNVGEPSAAAWQQLLSDLKAAYNGVLAFLNERRDELISAWTPINVAGMVATIGHNAYHLGAIRQLMLEVHGETGA